MDTGRQLQKYVILKRNRRLSFDIKIPTAKGVLYAVKIVPNEELNAGIREPNKKPKLLASEAHELWGYISSKWTIETAKDLGCNLFNRREVVFRCCYTVQRCKFWAKRRFYVNKILENFSG
jgi:hypothetical protein